MLSRLAFPIRSKDDGKENGRGKKEKDKWQAPGRIETAKYAKYAKMKFSFSVFRIFRGPSLLSGASATFAFLLFPFAFPAPALRADPTPNLLADPAFAQ